MSNTFPDLTPSGARPRKLCRAQISDIDWSNRNGSWRQEGEDSTGRRSWRSAGRHPETDRAQVVSAVTHFCAIGASGGRGKAKCFLITAQGGLGRLIIRFHLLYAARKRSRSRPNVQQFEIHQKSCWPEQFHIQRRWTTLYLIPARFSRLVGSE
jgi:hypothetical protein